LLSPLKTPILPYSEHREGISDINVISPSIYV